MPMFMQKRGLRLRDSRPLRPCIPERNRFCPSDIGGWQPAGDSGQAGTHEYFNPSASWSGKNRNDSRKTPWLRLLANSLAIQPCAVPVKAGTCGQSHLRQPLTQMSPNVALRDIRMVLQVECIPVLQLVNLRIGKECRKTSGIYRRLQIYLVLRCSRLRRPGHIRQ